MRVRIKVCGVTRREDAQLLAESGVDALGLNFVEGSPRRLTIERAGAIVEGLPPFLLKVGVFADASPDFVRQVAASCGLDWVQLHGRETPAECARMPVGWFKAHRVGAGFHPDDVLAYGRPFFLLDGDDGARLGGTGRTFDWSLAGAAAQHGSVVLAGGLTPENVGEAIRIARPFAVDVSSGVESSPGVKDPARLRLFCRRVAEAGAALDEDPA
jgi:phosphoribosylanthranilate isomerase